MFPDMFKRYTFFCLNNEIASLTEIISYVRREITVQMFQLVQQKLLGLQVKGGVKFQNPSSRA